MDAAQLKAKRGTVKALLTKTRDRITEESTLEQLEVYEQNVEGYRTRYDNIQDELDELITGDEREAQDDYRFDIYESITGFTAREACITAEFFNDARRGFHPPLGDKPPTPAQINLTPGKVTHPRIPTTRNVA
ncbi:hypothetical protein M8J77_018299 [Diaphorina citri]|nr:hypothetical protein M8J77_018299 [Diaphorina citri]